MLGVECSARFACGHVTVAPAGATQELQHAHRTANSYPPHSFLSTLSPDVSQDPCHNNSRTYRDVYKYCAAAWLYLWVWQTANMPLASWWKGALAMAAGVGIVWNLIGETYEWDWLSFCLCLVACTSHPCMPITQTKLDTPHLSQLSMHVHPVIQPHALSHRSPRRRPPHTPGLAGQAGGQGEGEGRVLPRRVDAAPTGRRRR